MTFMMGKKKFQNLKNKLLLHAYKERTNTFFP